MKTLYRVIAAILVWGALGLQYWLLAQGKSGPELVRASLNYASYFSVLTNGLAALAFTLPTIAGAAAVGRAFARPGVRTAVAMYALVVAGMYYAVLRQLWNPQGQQLLADTMLHYVGPALMLVDWAIFGRHGEVGWRAPPRWLVFPLAFAAWTLVHGAVEGFYPYPFVDVTALGYPQVLTNMAGVTALFAVLGYGFVALDRVLAVFGAGARVRPADLGAPRR